MSSGVLSGKVILDLTRATSGPFGSQILGDLGAEVIKIETPAGGVNPRESLEEPAYRMQGIDPFFLAVNRSKKSLVLDIAKPEGLQIFYDLARKADVVYDNFRPGIMDALGLGYRTLREINPRIICCSVTGFGSSGPLSRRAGFDVTLLAQSGAMAYVGKKDDRGLPVDIRVSMADLVGGTYAALAIGAALNRQRELQLGCRIEIAMHDVLISWFNAFALYPLNLGLERDIRPRMLWGAFPTKDRPIVLAGHRAGPFKKLCRALGHEEWLADERFNSGPRRAENAELLRSMVEAELLTKTCAEWLAIFEQAGVPYAEVLDMAEALNSAQTLSRNMVVTVEHPDYGEVKLLGNPIKIEGFEETLSPPPVYGEHSEHVLNQLLGFSPETLAELKAKNVIA